jgi:hypothetical protein
MMGQLYDVETPTINYHLKKVFSDSELEEEAVTRNFRITAADGKSYDTKHYNLAATIAVGYKVNSERAVQFRKWATRVVEEFTIKGFAMDDERLKRGGSVLGEKYFEEQLQRVREWTAAEVNNYLTEHELAQLSRLVNAYLDVAGDMALRKIPMTMRDWEVRLNRLLAATDREVLSDAGKVTAEIARAQAESELEEYRIVQDRLFESDFDRIVSETKRLGGGDANTSSRKGKKPRPPCGIQLGRTPTRGCDVSPSP